MVDMAKRLSLSMMLLAVSVAPAFAGGTGGASDDVGMLIWHAVKDLASQLAQFL
jgi:hypothetical protein